MKRPGITRKNGTVEKGHPDPSAPVQATTPRTQPASQAELKPTLDEVRRRAYEIYLHRQSTGRPGSPETDWIQAERELVTR